MKQKTVIGTIGLAINKQGQFLLTQRSQPGISKWDQKWNIPGGGLDFGEDPVSGLKRELWEELRVKPKLLLPHPIPVNVVWYAKDTGYDHDFHLLLLCYLIDIGDQEIDLSHDPEEETCDYKWYQESELDNLDCLPQTPETVRTCLELARKHAIMR
jgi:8-oxo-dGTP diphosphatase